MKKTILILAIPLLLGGVRGGLFAQDMGATALVAPTSPLCAASGQTVTVTIQNFDVTTIDFSVNPTSVITNITGPIPQSFTVTVSTGTLVASGTMNVDVTTVADFSTAGTYTVNANTTVAGDVNPANNAMAPVIITVNTLPVVALGADVTQCGGTVLLDAGNPGATYAWSTSATTQTINATITGTYSVVVTNGCGNSSDTINVSIYSNPPVNLGGSITLCNTAYLNAGNPGANYLWSTGETIQTIQVFSSGTYYVLVTDINGCTNSDTADVTINPLPVVNLGPDVTQCGGTVLLDAGNPGSTYLWSDASINQTLTVSASGTYSVIVTDVNGCSASDAADVTISLPVVNLGADVTQCGGTVLLDAGNPGATYLWSDASTNQTLTVSASGTYSVIVTDIYGCSDSDAVNVTINLLPTVNLGADVTQCGGTALLDAGNPGSTYLWSDASTNSTLTVSASGTYSVTVTDVNGCSASDAVNVTIDAALVVNLGPDVVQCSGMVLLDAGNPGSTYLWSDNSTNQTLFVSASGQYYVWVTNSCGSATDIINVTINTPPTVNLGVDVTQCGSATLDAGNPGLSYLWSTAETTQTISVSASGTYSVTVTDANGCSASDSVNVTINPIPVVNLGANITNCAGATLDAGNPGSSYLWNTGATTQTISATSAGTYYVTVTTANGCTGSDTVTISVSGTSTPLVQGFETGSSLSSYGWVVNNPDNGITWARITTVGKTGSVSMWKENFADTSIGQIDEVTTKAVDLTGGSAPPTLTFQLAYQLYSDPGTCTADCSDTLRIQVSTDCGNSWTTAYNKYGAALTTDSSAVFSTIPFEPTASQWRMETVSLSAFVAPSVLVKFININGYENNLYIDDVNINNGVGVEEINIDNLFSVFPNPTSGKFTIQLATGNWQLASSQKQVASIEIYNVYGEKVYSSTLNQVQGNNQSAIINLQDFPNGLYLLEVLTDDNTKTVKRVILNK